MPKHSPDFMASLRMPHDEADRQRHPWFITASRVRCVEAPPIIHHKSLARRAWTGLPPWLVWLR
jgi:hypothetical protein